MCFIEKQHGCRSVSFATLPSGLTRYVKESTCEMDI